MIDKFEQKQAMKDTGFRRRKRLALWLAILAILALAPQTLAQDDEPLFGDIVDVRVINLEVVVTDKSGERVHGLTADDFLLEIDGREAPIEFFTEVWGGVASNAVSTDRATVPALAPGAAVGTRYLIFIDDFFTLPSHRDRVLDELVEQTAGLQPEDRLAVVAYDGRRIDLLTSWTGSAKEITAAFAAARQRPAYGLRRIAEERRYTTTRRYGRRGTGSGFAATGFLGSGFSSFGGEDIHRSRELSQQVSRVAAAAAATMRGFAQPAGRKVMLLLSGGWPIDSSSWATGAFVEPLAYDGYASGRRLLAPLIDTANRLGYTLYPVDVPGRQRRQVSAEHGSLAESRIDANLQLNRELNSEDALLHLAEETGGRAFLDGASLTALRQTAADTRSYYWLGFTPDWQENDSRHRVEMKMRRPGLRVRTRSSFSDLSRSSERTMQMESAQLFALPLAGSGHLKASLGKVRGAGFGKVFLPVVLEIPVDQITMLPAADGYAARLELRIAALSKDGDRSEIPVLPVDLAGSELPRAEQVAIYETELKLRRTPQRLLISLHDPLSDLQLATEIDFQP